MILPLPDFLEKTSIDVFVLTESLLQYLKEAEATPGMLEPDQVLVVEDCKRFYFILTGIWWTNTR